VPDHFTEPSTAPAAGRSVIFAAAAASLLAACAATPTAPVESAPQAPSTEPRTRTVERESAPQDTGADQPATASAEPTDEPEQATTPEPDQTVDADARQGGDVAARHSEMPPPPPPPAATDPAPAETAESEPESTAPSPEAELAVRDRPERSTAASPETESGAQPAQALNRQIAGDIEVLRNGRELSFKATYLEQTIVAWRPDNADPAEPMEPQQIVTRSSRFFPQTMVVTSGTRVRFPNLDDIRHNVFSLTPGHRFDVGVYGPDEGADTVFDGVGTVEIYCNIHPNMAAFLLVLDSTHFTRPDQNGRFRLENLPPGPGELLVWNYRAEERMVRRALADSNRLGDDVSMTIDITRPSVPQHTTKEGRPYHLPTD
jgi:plastocyanin